MCREITNNISSYLEYYESIVPYNSVSYQELSGVITYNYSDFACGSGSVNVGFLPDNLISVCNEGFT